MSRAGPRLSHYAMADSAASSSSRSPGTSSAKSRARAAASSDERGPVRTAVDPAIQGAGAEAQDVDGLAAQPSHFDPRQGTLLGFELPEGVLLSMTATAARNDVAVGEAEETERAVQAELGGVEKQVSGRKAARAEKSAEKAVTPATPATPATPPAPTQAASATPSKVGRIEAPTPSAAVFLGEPSAPPDSAEPTALTRTVASLEAAFAQERGAAEERWRRTRHWLALALAGVALLLAVCVGQIVAFIGFADRSQAAQQQMQSALTEQRAALASMASATAALSAGTQTPEAPETASAPSAAPQPAKHARLAHLRHPREKAKPAAH